jgi:hypothetical protein
MRAWLVAATATVPSVRWRDREAASTLRGRACGSPSGAGRKPSARTRSGQVPRLVWLGCVTCGRHESLSLADSDGDRAE